MSNIDKISVPEGKKNRNEKKRKCKLKSELQLHNKAEIQQSGRYERPSFCTKALKGPPFLEEKFNYQGGMRDPSFALKH